MLHAMLTWKLSQWTHKNFNSWKLKWTSHLVKSENRYIFQNVPKYSFNFQRSDSSLSASHYQQNKKNIYTYHGHLKECFRVSSPWGRMKQACCCRTVFAQIQANGFVLPPSHVTNRGYEMYSWWKMCLIYKDHSKNRSHRSFSPQKLHVSTGGSVERHTARLKGDVGECGLWMEMDGGRVVYTLLIRRGAQISCWCSNKTAKCIHKTRYLGNADNRQTRQSLKRLQGPSRTLPHGRKTGKTVRWAQ